jgi:hypothetical protein
MRACAALASAEIELEVLVGERRLVARRIHDCVHLDAIRLERGDESMPVALERVAVALPSRRLPEYDQSAAVIRLRIAPAAASRLMS